MFVGAVFFRSFLASIILSGWHEAWEYSNTNFSGRPCMQAVLQSRRTSHEEVFCRSKPSAGEVEWLQRLIVRKNESLLVVDFSQRGKMWHGNKTKEIHRKEKRTTTKSPSRAQSRNNCGKKERTKRKRKDTKLLGDYARPACRFGCK